MTNADKYLESWTYWAGQSSINNPVKVCVCVYSRIYISRMKFLPFTFTLQSQMKVLSHTYARIIAGLPHAMSFNNVTARFSFSFYPLSSLAAEPTEIYLNKEMWYPSGSRLVCFCFSFTFSFSLLPSLTLTYSSLHSFFFSLSLRIHCARVPIRKHVLDGSYTHYIGVFLQSNIAPS